MKRTCLFLLVASAVWGGQLPGTIRKSVKLSAKAGPYEARSGVLIARGVVLAAGEGVVLNFGSTMANIDCEGRLVLTGSKDKPVVVNGGDIDGHITAKGVKFARCDVEFERNTTDILGLKNCYFDGGTLYFGYQSRKCVVSDCAFNGTSITSYGSSYYSYSGTHPRIDGCKFVQCSITLDTLVNATRCAFINCTFSTSGSIYLSKDTGVTTCYFDPTSLANVMGAARGAQYRKGRLFIKQGKKPKKDPSVPDGGLGSGLGSGLGKP